jgi:hypothetical protein
MLALLTLAADEPSKAPFEIMAAVLVVFAVAMASYGIAHHETFPPSKGVRSGLMFLMALLVAGTMAMAVVTA